MDPVGEAERGGVQIADPRGEGILPREACLGSGLAEDAEADGMLERDKSAGRGWIKAHSVSVRTSGPEANTSRMQTIESAGCLRGTGSGGLP